MNIEKFIEHWEKEGCPDAEYSQDGEVWTKLEPLPMWEAKYYRIACDRHWKLRQKWIESDFTLPIECRMLPDKDRIVNGWFPIDEPEWNQDREYREVEITALPSEPIVLKEKQSPLDIQHGGDHYQKLGQYQPWEVLAKWLTPEELKGAMKKEVISYLCREADKGGRLDIKKAAHTLEIYLELTKGEEK